MCVIIIADKHRPSEEMVAKAWAANDHGAGIAWREQNAEGKKLVRWSKGLNLDGVQALVRSAPLPFVVHFRIASVGGKNAKLTHPFPISHDAELLTEGETDGAVLFHNGHWNKWRETALEASIRSGVPVPADKWSDSRAMAWVASIHGIGVLEFIDEKTVAFGPEYIDITAGTGWKEVDGLWCSNDFFTSRTAAGWRETTSSTTNIGGPRSYSKMCRHPQCTRYDVDSEGYCSNHPAGRVLPADKRHETQPKLLEATAVETEKEKVIVHGPDGKPESLPVTSPFRHLSLRELDRMRNDKKITRRQYQSLKAFLQNRDEMAIVVKH